MRLVAAITLIGLPTALRRGQIPRVSQVSRRRLVRQQRDASVLRFGKIPISRMCTSAVQVAQRRARHDPLSLFLVYLYFGRFFRKRPSAEADSGDGIGEAANVFMLRAAGEGV
jgi:hypothetical protein